MLLALIQLCFVCCALHVSVVAASRGVDLSVATTAEDWKCLVREFNVTYAVVRSYRSVGEIDVNCADSLRYASKQGLKDLGIYMFPCIPSAPYSVSHDITCDSAEQQVQDVLQYLRKNDILVRKDKDDDKDSSSIHEKVVIKRIWLDIEDEVPAKYFDSEVGSNQAFISSMAKALARNDVPVGIYTTKTYWNNIMGNVEGYSSLPLWYPRYDGIDSLDFFEPFAGWQSVAFKQTAGDIGYCSIAQVDSDYAE